MSFLENLYKELILDHYKNPRNRGELADASLQQEGLNPSCGDELELFLKLDSGVIREVRFVGEGCAISQASASMMTEAIKGKPVEAALDLAEKFRAMLKGAEPADELGDLKMLQGISKLHARVKCAALGWVTLEEMLASGEDA